MKTIKMLIAILIILLFTNIIFANEIIEKNGNTTQIKLLRDELFGEGNENNINIDTAIDYTTNQNNPEYKIEHTCQFAKTNGNYNKYKTNASNFPNPVPANTELGHWEYCTVCGVTKNFSLHTYSEIEHWSYGNLAKCHSWNSGYKECTVCYYRLNIKEAHDIADAIESKNLEPWTTAGSCTTHVYRCIKCNELLGVDMSGFTGFENQGYCYTLKKDSAGNKLPNIPENRIKLGCNNPGICEACGGEYKAAHHYSGRKQMEGNSYQVPCTLCNEINGPIFSNYKMTRQDQDTLIIEFDMQLPTNDWSYDTTKALRIENDESFFTRYTRSATFIGNRTYHHIFTLIINPNWSGLMNKQLDLNLHVSENSLLYKGSAVEIDDLILQDTVFWKLKSDYNSKIIHNGVSSYFAYYTSKPQITEFNTVAAQMDPTGTWATIRSFTIKGTSWTNPVKSGHNITLWIYDSSNKLYYKGSVYSDGNTGEFKFTDLRFPIEAKEETQFYIKVADASGNVWDSREDAPNAIKNKLKISTTDSLPPTLLDINTQNSSWSKSKTITFEAIDKGSGNVKIGLSKNDLSLASQNGINYTKKYTFNGDLYQATNIRVFAVDDLGLISYKDYTLNKIDNTIPTITKIEQQKNDFGNTNVIITGHDNHSSKGAGSGISYFAVVKHGEKTQNSDFNIPAVKDNNQYIGITNLSYFGEYDFYAKDLVGNISLLETKTIDVDIKYNVNCEYICEKELKSILLKDVEMNKKTDFPELKILPETEEIIGWKYNDTIVNSSLDLDQYIKNNGETITIKFNNNNAYTSDDFLSIKYNINCQYVCENETKSVLLKNVKIGNKTELPALKVLPITEEIIGWKYNDTIVNSSLDLDKYIKNNSETITIKFNNNNAYTYDDFDSIKYNINCEYMCENELKSILINDVVIGTKTELPELKVLPITENVIGWKYNDLIVNSSIDLDKYVKNNNETITIKFANANAYTYDDFDNIIYNVLYTHSYFSYKINKFEQTITYKIGQNENLLELNNYNRFKNKGWYYDEDKVNNTSDLEKYILNNGQTIVLNFIIHFEKGELRTYSNGGYGGAERTEDYKRIIPNNVLNEDVIIEPITTVKPVAKSTKKRKDIIEYLNEIYNDFKEQNNITNKEYLNKDIIAYIQEIYIDFKNNINNENNTIDIESINNKDIIDYLNSIYNDFTEQNNIIENDEYIYGFTNTENTSTISNTINKTKKTQKIATENNIQNINKKTNQKNEININNNENSDNYINKVFDNYNDNIIIKTLIEKLQNRDYKGIYLDINNGKYSEVINNFLHNYNDIFTDLKIELSKNKYKTLDKDIKLEFNNKKYNELKNELQDIVKYYNDEWEDIKSNYDKKEYEYLLQNINAGKYKNFLNECISTITKKKYKTLIDDLQTKFTEGEYSDTFYDFVYFLLDTTYKYNKKETNTIEIIPIKQIETPSEIISIDIVNEKEKSPVILYVGVGVIVLIIIAGLFMFFRKKED